MNSPTDWLLVIKNNDGSKGYINLWEAIEQGRLLVKTSPLSRAEVTDACADCPENRHDIDTNFGLKNPVEKAILDWGEKYHMKLTVMKELTGEGVPSTLFKIEGPDNQRYFFKLPIGNGEARKAFSNGTTWQWVLALGRKATKSLVTRKDMSLYLSDASIDELVGIVEDADKVTRQ